METAAPTRRSGRPRAWELQNMFLPNSALSISSKETFSQKRKGSKESKETSQA